MPKSFWMPRSVAVVLAAGIAATAVHAQDAVAIAKRRNTMMAFGKAVRLPNSMMRGDVAFDAAKLRASLKTILDTAVKGKTVFPDNSKVGDTEALPAAFERKTDLFARFDALAAMTQAAPAASRPGHTQGELAQDPLGLHQLPQRVCQAEVAPRVAGPPSSDGSLPAVDRLLMVRLAGCLASLRVPSGCA